MRPPATKAGETSGARAPSGAAALLAAASCLGGCALGPGDLGRPRQSFLDTALEQASPAATAPERELDRRLRHFRADIPHVAGHTPPARLNALRDAIETDRALTGPLLATYAQASDRQRIRTAVLRQLSSVEAESRRLGQGAMTHHADVGSEICGTLDHRARAYRIALENAVARAPEAEAVAAERGLLAFEAEVARACASGVAHERPLRIDK